MVQGAAPFEALSDLLAGGMQLLANQWRLSAAQQDPLISRLRSLVGPPTVFGLAALTNTPSGIFLPALGGDVGSPGWRRLAAEPCVP